MRLNSVKENNEIIDFRVFKPYIYWAYINWHFNCIRIRKTFLIYNWTTNIFHVYFDFVFYLVSAMLYMYVQYISTDCRFYIPLIFQYLFIREKGVYGTIHNFQWFLCLYRAFFVYTNVLYDALWHCKVKLSIPQWTCR